MQTTTVLKMLANGRTVSTLTAVHLGIGNIRDVIRRLRLQGWYINTVTDTDGNGRKFTKYELVDDIEVESARAASALRAAA